MGLEERTHLEFLTLRKPLSKSTKKKHLKTRKHGNTRTNDGVHQRND